MTQEANEFLSAWIKDNIRAMPYNLHKMILKQAVELCITKAESAGITKRELNKAANGNLGRYIANALEDAQDAALKSLRKKAGDQN